MKKNGILNSDISRVLSYMGHTDTLAIVDCGFPIPPAVECIDLSVKFGMPLFLDVLKEVINDFEVEAAILANEIKGNNPVVLSEALSLFNEEEVQFVSHDMFKKLVTSSKAIIRTGEATPYANIILRSGCTFKV